MANLGKWNAAEAVTCVLFTELNGLANNAFSALSAAFANQTGLDIYCDVELLATFPTAPTMGNSMNLYLAPSIDDSNYGTDYGTCIPLAVFPLANVTSEQRVPAIVITLPPHSVKFRLENKSGQTLGNGAVRIARFDVNLNG